MGEKKDKPGFAHYAYVHERQTLWMGEAEQEGSRYRAVCVTSDHPVSEFGPFQVYTVEGDSKVTPPKLIYSADFDGHQLAEKKFRELIRDYKKEGFKRGLLP
jgi:hypothetical protein